MRLFNWYVVYFLLNNSINDEVAVTLFTVNSDYADSPLLLAMNYINNPVHFICTLIVIEMILFSIFDFN